jgi:hypothetical protein
VTYTIVVAAEGVLELRVAAQAFLTQHAPATLRTLDARIAGIADWERERGLEP